MAEEWRQYSGRWNLQTQGQAAGAFKWPGVVIPERLWGWGVNNNGQIGYGDTTNYSSPVQVGSLSWPEISAGATFSLAVDPNGKLWSTGSNNYGQLGLGNTASYSSFTQVGALTTWSKPAALGGGGDANAAIKTDGTLWTWGYNNKGQLGLGDTISRSSPVQVGTDTDWAEISMGSFAAAIKTDGTLYAWGYNYAGNLGQGNTITLSSPAQIGSLTTWSKVTIGSGHCLALKTDGTIWAWGSSFQGQLGQGNTTYHSSPVQVGALTTWSKAEAIFSNASSGINTSGQLFTWGRNGEGQLGLGDTSQRNSPVQVGALTNWDKIEGGNNCCAAIKTDKTLWTWGSGVGGRLGLGDTANRNSPVQVGALATWSQVTMNNLTLATKALDI